MHFSDGLKVFWICAILSGCHVKSQETEDWMLGPFVKQDTVNPIMGPLNTTTFDCPIWGNFVYWEEKDVFNPTALVRDGKIHLLYRAEDIVGDANGTSRIGLATTSNGFTLDRHPKPIFFPDNDDFLDYEWDGGCEDPRIVETENGTYILTYTAYDGDLARLMVASTTDLRSWKKHGPVFMKAGYANETWSKAGSIVTKRDGDKFIATKINGKFWMYWGETSIFVATSDNLVDWYVVTDEDTGNFTEVIVPREGMFDSDIVEPGPQSFLLDDESAIFLIYNSRNLPPDEGGDPNFPARTYCAGQALMSASDPTKLIKRSKSYFFHPEKPYEIEGQVNWVVFLEGLAHFQNKWYLFYGTADSKIAVAISDEKLGFGSEPSAASINKLRGSFFFFVGIFLFLLC